MKKGMTKLEKVLRKSVAGIKKPMAIALCMVLLVSLVPLPFGVGSLVFAEPEAAQAQTSTQSGVTSQAATQDTTVTTSQPQGTAVTAPKTFKDLGGHWAKSIIEEAASLGIVGGYPEGDYKPDNLMKREEFFKIVINILTKKPEITADTKTKLAKFGDVLPSEWYVSTIESAIAAGITEGNTYYSFGIGMMVTRQEAAKVISTIIDEDTKFSAEALAKGEEKFASTKDKAKIDSWAYDHVKKVFARGYIQGDNEGNFNPTNALTRAEAATLLLNVVKNEKVILGPSQSREDLPKPAETTPSAVTSDTAINTKGGIDDDEVKIVPKKVTGSNIGCKKTHDVKAGAFTNGAGTIADPYVIETEEQLNHIREHATEGAFFILKNDIEIETDFAKQDKDIEESEIWADGNFVPIGTKKEPFNGHIDGNGYGIYGIEIKGTAQYAAFISFLSENGTITNLLIDESNISGGQYVAGFVAMNEGTISNCTLGKKTTISGNSYTGGIAGYTKSTITGNRNKGEIVGRITATGGIAGGIMIDNGYISGCVNDGKVSGLQKVGGIVGAATGFGKGVMIESCSNRGTVESTSYNAGGIVGEGTASGSEITLQRCYNKGVVTGSALNGGIIAKAEREITVQNSYNLGKVYGSGTGGIVGINAGQVEYSANKGEVFGKAFAGGIIGSQEENKALVQYCYNDGEVKSDSTAGGIAGENSQKIKNCYNTGDISAKTYAGGIVGSNKSNITIAYNIGEIEANLTGEITGFNGGTLSYVFWIESDLDGAVGQSESIYTTKPKVAKKLTADQLRGNDKVEINTDQNDYIVKLLNTFANDEVWEEVKDYKYPSLVNFERE